MPDLLYYPRINAPRPVIYQALLYWDHFYTVTPPGPVEEFLDPTMRRLHADGLYTPIPADHWPARSHLWGGMEVNHALQRLTDLLDRIPADDLIPHDGPESHDLHVLKISSALINELERRGLSQRISDTVIRVSAATQLCLFSVAIRDIAGEARRIREGHGWARESDGRTGPIYPCTDSPAAHLFAHTPIPYSGDLTHPCWDVEIGGLMPVPSEEVQINDLLAFRERYADERLRLIIAINRLLHELQREHDSPHDVLHRMRGELEAALTDLQSAGKSRRITWIRRSITATIALATAYAGQKVFPDAGWILGVICGAAINVGTNETRQSSRGSGTAEDFSYLHRVHTALNR